MLALPHSLGCLVCGRDNPHGLRLSLTVDPSVPAVQTIFTPGPFHIGFTGVIHGGLLATVADEAMVWAAIWASRRACLAAEMSIRFRRKVSPGDRLHVRATLIHTRARLIEAACEVSFEDGDLAAAASGKYVPLPSDDTRAFLDTLQREPSVEQAFAHLLAIEPAKP